VRLVHSVVRDSVASFGGGIANRNTLTLINSTVTGNFAALGGGIWSSHKLTLINSTVSGNTTPLPDWRRNPKQRELATTPAPRRYGVLLTSAARRQRVCYRERRGLGAACVVRGFGSFDRRHRLPRCRDWKWQRRR
jgi:hypothetical protein